LLGGGHRRGELGQTLEYLGKLSRVVGDVGQQRSGLVQKGGQAGLHLGQLVREGADCGVAGDEERVEGLLRGGQGLGRNRRVGQYPEDIRRGRLELAADRI